MEVRPTWKMVYGRWGDEQIENRQNWMLMMAERVFGWERGKSRQEVEGVGASALQGVTLHSVHCAHCTHLYIARLQYKCVQRKSAESTPMHSRHNASKPMHTPGAAGLPVLGWHARKVNRALLPFHSNHNKVPQIALLTDFKYLKPCVTYTIFFKPPCRLFV